MQLVIGGLFIFIFFEVFTELAQYGNVHLILMIPDVNILFSVGHNPDSGLQFLRYTAFTDGVTVSL